MEALPLTNIHKQNNSYRLDSGDLELWQRTGPHRGRPSTENRQGPVAASSTSPPHEQSMGICLGLTRGSPAQHDTQPLLESTEMTWGISDGQKENVAPQALQSTNLCRLRILFQIQNLNLACLFYIYTIIINSIVFILYYLYYIYTIFIKVSFFCCCYRVDQLGFSAGFLRGCMQEKKKSLLLMHSNDQISKYKK